MRTLSATDLEHLLLGCTVLATGGGGDLQKGLKRVRAALDAGKGFKMLGLDEVPDDALLASPYFCGSLTSFAADASSGEHAPGVSPSQGGRVPVDVLAFRALQEYFREDFFAAVATELGGGNTAAALVVAATLNIPLLDGDPAGRAVPELQHSTFFVNQIPIAPLSVANHHGDVVIVKEVLDDFRAERVVRALAVESGGVVGVTDHPLRGRQAKAALIPNTLSYAQKIGQVLKKSKDYRKVAEAGGGRLLFKGKVTRSPWKDQDGFTVGEIFVQGQEEYQGSSYRIWYKNEHIVAWRDDQVQLTAPDLICVLSRQEAMPISNPHCREGSEIAVIGYPAPKEWRSPAGLKVLGPGSFGFDTPYIPLEERDLGD